MNESIIRIYNYTYDLNSNILHNDYDNHSIYIPPNYLFEIIKQLYPNRINDNNRIKIIDIKW